jgi:hypothetical protein
MKKDTSNIVDLDNMFEPAQPEAITESAAEETTVEQISINMNEILEEWSYRLPKGYPTIVNGVFTERVEVEILNQLLEDRGLKPLPLPEAVSTNQLSSNPTDIKEAMVCLFVDAGLLDTSLFTIYRKSLDKKLPPADRKSIAASVKRALTTAANNYGKNYGISGYAKMPEFVAQAILNPQQHRPDLVIINNGVGAADAILSEFEMLTPGMVRREKFFNDVRNHAVNLIDSNYQIKGYFPDNWCPGDIYFLLDPAKAASALQTKRLNVGADSLNNYFYGTSNPKGSILAVSLKMQKAQAGKGTTFVKTVVVDGVTPQDKMGKDTANQQVIKFRDIRRRLETYYINSDDWKTDPKTFEKVRISTGRLAKIAKLSGIPIKSTQTKELRTYLNKNKEVVVKAIASVSKKLGKSIDTVTTFQQAYTRFVNNLKGMKIQKVEGDSKSFLKSIENKNKQEYGGKLNQTKMQELLSQKAATYDLASSLIEKWTEKTKKISPAFADHLKAVKNPFVAITLFAIAQHGLNPNFFKAIGTNNATTGTISEFPSNSVVDEKKSIQQLKIVDSPGQAGFYIEYLLSINDHTYRTTLTFRFSKDQIRIEVEELAKV